MEYKGGFLSQQAKYSVDSQALTDDLELKIATGCSQLASKLGRLFARNPADRDRVPSIRVDHISKVLPILIVQDHALRGPAIDGWLNRRFAELMAQSPIRAGVEVLPLNVINVEDLERLVESWEGNRFDFIDALHNKAVRDPEMKSPLHNFLLGWPGYASGESARPKEIHERQWQEMSSYMFAAQTPSTNPG